jgi:hypothetical protein
MTQDQAQSPSTGRAREYGKISGSHKVIDAYVFLTTDDTKSERSSKCALRSC